MFEESIRFLFLYWSALVVSACVGDFSPEAGLWTGFVGVMSVFFWESLRC